MCVVSIYNNTCIINPEADSAYMAVRQSALVSCQLDALRLLEQRTYARYDALAHHFGVALGPEYEAMPLLTV